MLGRKWAMKSMKEMMTNNAKSKMLFTKNSNEEDYNGPLQEAVSHHALRFPQHEHLLKVGRSLECVRKGKRMSMWETVLRL